MSVFARRSEQYELSVEIAKKAYNIKPTFLNTSALGTAYKDLKDSDNVIKFFEESISIKPEVIEVKLDLADYLCHNFKSDSDLYKKGLKLYEKVLESSPKHPWAYPSILYFRYRMDWDTSIKEELEFFSYANSQNTRAKELCYYLRPYETYIPEPTESMVQMLKHIIRMSKNNERMSNITVSNYESASSYIALKLYCKLSGISEPTLRLPPISSEGDPRKIITKTKYTLWKTIGDFLEPALNAPKEEISNIVVLPL